MFYETVSKNVCGSPRPTDADGIKPTEYRTGEGMKGIMLKSEGSRELRSLVIYWVRGGERKVQLKLMLIGLWNGQSGGTKGFAAQTDVYSQHSVIYLQISIIFQELTHRTSTKQDIFRKLRTGTVSLPKKYSCHCGSAINIHQIDY